MNPTPQPPAPVMRFAASVLRHFLTLGAGALVGAGALPGQDVPQFVTVGLAIALWAVAMVWSWVEKGAGKAPVKIGQ